MPRWLLTVLLTGAAAAGVATLWRSPLVTSRPSAPREPVARPPAATNDCFDLHAGLDRMAVPPRGQVERTLVVTVTGRADCGATRLPLDLALVVDVSGSMRDDHKLTHARSAALSLLDRLDETDHVSLVSFSDNGRIWGTEAATSELPREWLRGLTPEGGTNLGEGLEEGLGMLTPQAGRLRRVLLLTDGRANLGLTTADQLVPLLTRRDDVTVSTMGLGADYDELLLGALAESGHGRFHHAETVTDLADAYASELEGARHVAARGVELRITPPAGGTLTPLGGTPVRATDTGVIATIGDLAAGETRTIVVHVTTGPDASGGTTIDAVGQRPGGPQRLQAMATVTPIVSADPRAWEVQDPRLVVAVARAEAAEDLALAREEYLDGRREEAQRRLDSRVQALLQVQNLHLEADFAPVAAKLHEISTAPTAALQGKRAYATSQELAQ